MIKELRTHKILFSEIYNKTDCLKKQSVLTFKISICAKSLTIEEIWCKIQLNDCSIVEMTSDTTS